VVTTDLPAVREFNDHHQVLTTTTPQADSFLAAIESALAAPSNQMASERRRQVAALSDWKLQVENMSSLIEKALSRKN
jgi:hypothetical protein